MGARARPLHAGPSSSSSGSRGCPERTSPLRRTTTRSPDCEEAARKTHAAVDRLRLWVMGYVFRLHNKLAPPQDVCGSSPASRYKARATFATSPPQGRARCPSASRPLSRPLPMSCAPGRFDPCLVRFACARRSPTAPPPREGLKDSPNPCKPSQPLRFGGRARSTQQRVSGLSLSALRGTASAPPNRRFLLRCMLASLAVGVPIHLVGAAIEAINALICDDQQRRLRVAVSSQSSESRRLLDPVGGPKRSTRNYRPIDARPAGLWPRHPGRRHEASQARAQHELGARPPGVWDLLAPATTSTPMPDATTTTTTSATTSTAPNTTTLYASTSQASTSTSPLTMQTPFSTDESAILIDFSKVVDASARSRKWSPPTLQGSKFDGLASFVLAASGGFAHVSSSSLADTIFGCSAMRPTRFAVLRPRPEVRAKATQCLRPNAAPRKSDRRATIRTPSQSPRRRSSPQHAPPCSPEPFVAPLPIPRPQSRISSEGLARPTSTTERAASPAERPTHLAHALRRAADGVRCAACALHRARHPPASASLVESVVSCSALRVRQLSRARRLVGSRGTQRRGHTRAPGRHRIRDPSSRGLPRRQGRFELVWVSACALRARRL